MARMLLTARPQPVRRPTQRGSARPRAPLAGPVPSHGPLLQRQQTGNGTAPQRAVGLESHIPGHKALGRPLPETTRIAMESRFGVDFSAVKIHTDGQAAQMSRALNAQAFTFGNDIFFDRARYDPGSAEGGRLLAHELSHVVQRQQGEVSPEVIQRAHADVKQPPATEPEPKPPVDCAAEITQTRTCWDVINEMSRLRFDMAEHDSFIERYDAEGNVDGSVTHTLRKAELQLKYNEKDRVRVACCPNYEVPPVAPTAAPEPQAPAVAPTPSPVPKAP